MKTAFEYLLQCAGFEPAAPDVWGKNVGEATAFVEISPDQATAFAWLPDTEVYLGPKIVLTGAPDDTVPAALFQLQTLLAEEEASGSLSRAFVTTEERLAASPAC